MASKCCSSAEPRYSSPQHGGCSLHLQGGKKGEIKTLADNMISNHSLESLILLAWEVDTKSITSTAFFIYYSFI